MCQNFIKLMGGKGTIVNLVSLGASFTAPGMSSYACSKLAVIKLGELLSHEHPDLRGKSNLFQGPTERAVVPITIRSLFSSSWHC